MKLKLAVIGKDVSKSVSPVIQQFIAKKCGRDIDYAAVSVPEEQFKGRIEGLLREYDGLNVTIPYKLAIIPYLKSLNGDALLFGAVNTVKCGALQGYNTDGIGFMTMLANNGVEASGQKVLLLGAGGAGRSVAAKLCSSGAKLSVYDINYANVLGLCKEFPAITPIKTLQNIPYDIIINATGVGMHKTEGVSPAGAELLSLCGTAVDLIYAPAESKFLQIAKSAGKRTLNGGGMLFYQAYHAQCIWCGAEPDFIQADTLYKEFSKEIKL